LGFRGEALPSISAVSRVVLKTSDGKGEKGTMVEREGEELIRVSDIAFPKGTSVEVKDLFFNLPARKKFLRSDRSELNFNVKYLTSVSLAYPGVRFSLTHGERKVFDYPTVGTLKERIFQVYGKSILEGLMEVDFGDDEKKIYGYTSLPPSGRRDRSHQLFFVNKRPVKDRTLQAALNQAYRGFLEKDQFAEAFLFLYYPYSEVDINVHPAKAEVRFKDSSPVFQLVHLAIEQAMLKDKGVKEIYPSREEEKRSISIEEERIFHSFATVKERETREQELFPIPAKEEGISPRVLG